MGLFENVLNLALFENLDNKGYYMLFLSSPETAQRRYEQYTRTGRYDETGMKDPYGYIELNISAPALYKLEAESESKCEQFLRFIKDNKVVQHIEIRLASSWGWYKFSEEIGIKKWFAEFNDQENKRLQELAKASNIGRQTALF